MNQAINNFNYDCLHMKTVKLTDLFDIVNVNDLERIETNNNDVPLVGNTSHNNSIVDYVDYYNFEGDCICISSSVPIVGFCSVHHGKIAINNNNNIIIIKLKDKFKHLTDCLSCFAGNLSQYFHLKYLKCFRITVDQIKNELIPRVPFIQSTDDPHKMIIDKEGLKYAFNFWSEGCDDKNKQYNPDCVRNKRFIVNEIFNYAGTGRRTKGTNKGYYPLISRSGDNNGITEYINEYDYDGNYISVAGDSNAPCFAQCGKFAITVKLYLLQLKPEYKHMEQSLTIIAYWMKKNFENNYSYQSGINAERLMKESITLPVVVSGLTQKQEQQIDFTSDQFKYELNSNLMNWFCWKWFI